MDLEGLEDLEALGNLEALGDLEGLGDLEAPGTLEALGDLEGLRDLGDLQDHEGLFCLLSLATHCDLHCPWDPLCQGRLLDQLVRIDPELL